MSPATNVLHIFPCNSNASRLKELGKLVVWDVDFRLALRFSAKWSSNFNLGPHALQASSINAGLSVLDLVLFRLTLFYSPHLLIHFTRFLLVLPVSFFSLRNI